MTAPEQTGVLLCNLGTPDAPTTPALRRYLKEFLSDPRVVDMPRLLWLPILHCVILNIRPRKSAALYRKIWTERGSPLLDIGLRQQAALQQLLDTGSPGRFRVQLAMRYGRPSIAGGLRALCDAGCRTVIVLPLYPQYSTTTTESTFDALNTALAAMEQPPEIRRVRHYHDHPAYIEALAAAIREDFAAHGKPDKLLLSFHGIPRRYHEAGDPYPDECRRTAELLAEQMGLDDADWLLTFQSRFGREEWLRPYTDETLQSLPGQGVGSVAVACPGFAADCLETLEEIAIQNRRVFMDAGGREYRYIPALNDRSDHIRLLAKLVTQHAGNQENSATREQTSAAHPANAMSNL